MFAVYVATVHCLANVVVSKLTRCECGTHKRANSPMPFAPLPNTNSIQPQRYNLYFYKLLAIQPQLVLNPNLCLAAVSNPNPKVTRDEKTTPGSHWLRWFRLSWSRSLLSFFPTRDGLPQYNMTRSTLVGV